MVTSLKGKIEIASHEGICLTKYLDSVGVWTIGIGATVTEIKDINELPRNYTITMQEAFDLFERSLKRYERAINKYVDGPIEQHAFDALVSWCYNVGTGWARKATVIRRINAGDSKNSIFDALMMFRKPREIIGRRKKEAHLLVNGTYGNGKALLFPVNNRSKPVYSKGKTIDIEEYLNG